jgi:hypothetical protein
MTGTGALETVRVTGMFTEEAPVALITIVPE